MGLPGLSARYWAPILLLAGGLVSLDFARSPLDAPNVSEVQAKSAVVKKFVTQHCIQCHNGDDNKGGLALDVISADAVAGHPGVWEKVVRKLSARQMPPLHRPRPDEQTYEKIIAALESELDRAAAAKPNPGRTPTLRRLNRVEYQNAIKDLLALDIDAAALLPADEPNHGFDTAPLGDLSPTLMERYITAAQKISRLAMERAPKSPNSDTFRVAADVTQEGHVEGLPLGTRGGILIPFNFPQDGEYDIQAWLARDRNEEVEGLKEPHELQVLLNKKHMASLTVKPPANKEGHNNVDAKLKARIVVTAGPHDVGVTFVQNPASLQETKRQPYQSHYNLARHPRTTPAIYQVSITGPYNPTGRSETPSRRRILVSAPTGPAEEVACAKNIISTLLRRAYRRPVTEANLDKIMKFYQEGRKEADFDAGIEAALSAVLVNPQFLFIVEADPKGVPPNTAYKINDVELASRVSFFLWSTIPDDELLDLASANKLSQPAVFERQVRRMLSDARSKNLATHFAGQWLHLGNLDSIIPDLRLFTDFDDNLRKAFRQETELFFESVIREDASVLKLLKADYTFLDERLAKHYDIPHVYGNRFRRVQLDSDKHRGGLLRHGSILTVTSYATRTSPVVRGKWILENLLGTPPPPPPANVPPLKDKTSSIDLSIRDRLAEHRDNIACAGCHRLIDPVGFSLEQFDAIGRWRTMEDGKPVDAAGGLPDGSEFDGVDGLEKALLQRPELFVRTFTEKLFIFALGRAPQESDAPAIRKIIRDARANHYRFSSLIVGITTSAPFQMRMSQ